MAQERPPATVIRDFPGLRTNADPEDLRPGEGREQRNVTSERPGELRVRKGWKRVRFEG